MQGDHSFYSTCHCYRNGHQFKTCQGHFMGFDRHFGRREVVGEVVGVGISCFSGNDFLVIVTCFF